MDDSDRVLYLALLEEISQRHACDVHAYVLMTNHAHLLVSPVAPDGASRMMKDLGQRYVQSFNRRHKRTGTLWEGRFKSSIIDSDAYLLRCHCYIEENPVRAAMVMHPRDYRWSSYRGNAQGADSTLLRPHPIYLALGTAREERLEAYRRLFTCDTHHANQIRTALNSGLPLGNAEFIARLGGRLGSRVTFGKTGRPRKSEDRPGDSPFLSLVEK